VGREERRPRQGGGGLEVSSCSGASSELASIHGRRRRVGSPEPPDSEELPRWAKIVRGAFQGGQALLGFAFMALIAYLVIAVAIDIISGGGNSNGSGGPTLSRADAEATVKRYYGSLDHFSYKQAWNYLDPAEHAARVGFGTWSHSLKRNYEMNLTEVTVTPVNRTTATAAVILNRADYDACNRKIWETYEGTLTVKLMGRAPRIDGESLTKTAGPDPVTARAACQTILPPPPTEPVANTSGAGSSGDNCDPSYPDQCLEDGIGDYDCSSSFDAGYSGGPNVAYGPLEVTGSDPFGLDRDGNGIGCEEG
jgi:hypothetical protein